MGKTWYLVQPTIPSSQILTCAQPLALENTGSVDMMQKKISRAPAIWNLNKETNLLTAATREVKLIRAKTN